MPAAAPLLLKLVVVLQGSLMCPGITTLVQGLLGGSSEHRQNGGAAAAAPAGDQLVEPAKADDASSAPGLSFVLLTGQQELVVYSGANSFAVSLLSPNLSVAVGPIGAPTRSISIGATEPASSVMLSGNLSRVKSPWTLELCYAPISVEVAAITGNVTLSWSPSEQVLRKTFGYLMAGPAQPHLMLAEIVMERVHAASTLLFWHALDPQQSYPAFVSGFFVGIEFPYASSKLDGDGFTLAHQPGMRFHAANVGRWLQSRTAVYGVAPVNKTERQAFEAYLASNRAGRGLHIGRHVNYNVWWTLPCCVDRQTQVLSLVDTFKENLFTPFNFSFDSFILDLGWSEPNSFWQINAEMHDALAPIKAALADIGARFGLWISPSSMYPPATNCSWLQEHGYEVMPNNIGCFGGRNYSNAWAATVKGLVRDHGIQYFKLDGLNLNCPSVDHGHEKGALGNEMLISHFLAALDGARAEDAELFLEGTFASPYPSPFFLFHIDSMMSSYGDDSPNGQIPSVSYREAVTSARDFANLHAAAFLPSPPAGNEVLGVIHQNDDDFLNDGVMVLGRGHQLVPNYVNPTDMVPARWKQLVELHTWGRENAALLAPTVPIMPSSWRDSPPPTWGDNLAGLLPREPYGYVHYVSGELLVTLRNPWMPSQSIDIDLGEYVVADQCPWVAGSMTLVSLYPEARVYAAKMSCGATVQIPLAPFETVVLRAYPSTVSTDDLRDVATALNQSMHFPSAPTSALGRVIYNKEPNVTQLLGLNWYRARTDRECGMSMPLTPCPSMDDSSRLQFDSNFTVEVADGAVVKLVVFVEGTSSVGSFVSRLSVNGVDTDTVQTTSDQGFTATGAPPPLFWRTCVSDIATVDQKAEVMLSMHSDSGGNATRVSAWLWVSKLPAQRKRAGLGAAAQLDLLPEPENLSLESLLVFDGLVNESSLTHASSRSTQTVTISGVFLDAVTPLLDIEGFGPGLKATKNMRIDAQGPLSLLNKSTIRVYDRGLGVCPLLSRGELSRLVYGLGQGYERFRATVGLDTQGDRGLGLLPAVNFSVLVDNITRYVSPVKIRANDIPQVIDISVSGAHTLELRVGSERDDGTNAGDYADWADAQLRGSHLVDSATLGTLVRTAGVRVGMRLVVGPHPLVVTAIGRMCIAGNTKNHTLRISRASENFLVASAVVAMAGCPAGLFMHGLLSEPVTLNATAYFVTSDEAGDSWAGTGTLLAPTAQARSAGAVISGSASWSGTSWQIGPVANSGFGPVDIQFATPSLPIVDAVV
jgi:hypothetical protein